LIQELPSLFSSADILNLDDAKVASLASESEESSIEITVCSEKIKGPGRPVESSSGCARDFVGSTRYESLTMT
jgi:hypothetical protein